MTSMSLLALGAMALLAAAFLETGVEKLVERLTDREAVLNDEALTHASDHERLAALAPAWLVPAHGAVIDEPVAHLEHYVAHRLGREARVVAALAQGPGALPAVTVLSYPDVPTVLHPLAERSCLAHLIKLEEEDRARELDGVWSAA